MRRTRFAASAGRRFVLLGVIPILLLGVIGAVQLYESQVETITVNNQLIALGVSAHIEGLMAEPLQIADQLRGAQSDASLQAIMDSATKNIIKLESVLLIGDDGTVHQASADPVTGAHPEDLIGLDQSRNMQCIEAWSTGQAAWSGVFTSPVSGRPAISVAVPVDGRLALMTVSIETLPDQIHGSSVAPDAVCIVLDRDGQLVYHSDPSIAAERQNLSTLEPVRKARGGIEGNYRYIHRDQEMLGSTLIVSGPEWTVLVERDWGQASRPVTELLLLMAGSMLATSLLAIVFAFLFARDLARPISELQGFTETVRRGDYDGKIGAYRHIEFAELADSIRAMATAVRDREDRLETAQDSLEASNTALREVIRSSTEAMGKVVSGRDPYTQGHQIRVAKLAVDIAREMRVDPHDIEGIELAALVHDIGKLAIPVDILVRPGRITPIEYEFIKQHPQWGYEFLQAIPYEWPIADMVLQHHERLDGSGYPHGLSVEQILLGSRIIAVADVVEAIASHRPYRPALGIEAALEEVTTRPDLYDAQVVAAAVALAESGRLHLDEWHDR